MKSFNIYQASGQGQLPEIKPNEKLNDPKLYLPSKGLVSAVNVALTLGQPLLLTGEPGTGKTQLAHHIAYFFNLGKPLIFNAQTTSTAKDLFYRYDALGHFQYSQTQTEPLTAERVEENYIKYEALGEAIKSKQKRVVLIDEIDKAPRDLPNDVLAALEELKFRVPEIDDEFVAEPSQKPIIIMTSNSEKNLPEPFLRRVVFYHIPFPDHEMLLKILSAKVEGFGQKDIEPIIAHFEHIRKSKRIKLQKKPATAELIQWASLLYTMSFDPHQLSKLESISDDAREQLQISYSVLAKNKEDLKTLIDQL